MTQQNTFFKVFLWMCEHILRINIALNWTWQSPLQCNGWPIIKGCNLFTPNNISFGITLMFGSIVWILRTTNFSHKWLIIEKVFEDNSYYIIGSPHIPVVTQTYDQLYNTISILII